MTKIKKTCLTVCGIKVFGVVRQTTDGYEAEFSGATNQLCCPDAIYGSGYGATVKDAIADYVASATRRMSR